MIDQKEIKERCVGCTVCVNICPKNCIHMERDEEGFYYPVVDQEQCIQCGRCVSICPTQKKSLLETEPNAYAAILKDEQTRMESTSGGVFSAIANWIIDKGGVVYGAAYNQKCEVEHICVETSEELNKLRGAKYSESRLGQVFSDVLERLKQQQYVLFSGTPCQVAGLKSFLNKDYEKLICVDFICHGIPSSLVWEKYVQYQMKKDSEQKVPVYINLRDKVSGWSRYQYSHCFEYKNGKKTYVKNADSLFMKLFVGDYINRRSCSDCQFKGYSRISDFTLGDFWGIWDSNPEMDDNKGTSAVLVQSEKAMNIWDEINDQFNYKKMELNKISEFNPSILYSAEASKKRKKIINSILKCGIKTSEKLIDRNSILLVNKVIRRLKKCLKFYEQ